MFNPIKAANEIKNQFLGYVSTTFEFRNRKLQEKFSEELKSYVSNGPFVEINDTFKSGKTLNQLIETGVISPLFKHLESLKKEKAYKLKLPLDRPLYVHQEQAITKIVAGDNVVISTGTGSGKTNCFLIPVINELLKEIEQGTLNDGVRAMFIYPMNALANDQVIGLREILMMYPQIRFGVYNGGTENGEEDAIRLYNDMFKNAEYSELREPLSNEVLSRDEMKKRPPHILFTNYAMLEHLLLRPGDDVIFSNSNFKFIVLDEGHVYVGATGIETAFLMRRLIARVGTNPQFIITSATLGDGTLESNEKVIRFAENLTGNHFYVDDIIIATREQYVSRKACEDYPNFLFRDLNKSLSDEQIFFEDVLKKYDISFSLNQDSKEIIFDIISHSNQYRQLKELHNHYKSNKKLLTFEKLKKELNFDEESAVGFINLCAKARKNNKPLIDIRYHYFLRAIDGAYLALDDYDSLTLTRSNYSVNNKKMFEIGVCDDCGEISIIGKIVDNRLVRSPDREDFSLFQEYTDEMAQQFEDVAESSKEKNDILDLFQLCKNCGAIVEEGYNLAEFCKCPEPEASILVKVKKDKCKICNGTLRRFNLGQEAATGVIATALFENIPEYSYVNKDSDTQTKSNNPFLRDKSKFKSKVSSGSQFLVFSDSRQGAAKFACYMSEAYKEFLRRRSIWHVLDDIKNKYNEGIDFEELVSILENYYSANKLFRKSNKFDANNSKYDNSRNAWVALLNELISSTRSTSLTSLRKISFSYKGNDDDICATVASMGNMSKAQAKSFLDLLVFDIIKFGAIETKNPLDLKDSDRIYLYYMAAQKTVSIRKNNKTYSMPWLPTPMPGKQGQFYRSNRLTRVMKYLNMNQDEALEFLEHYWTYLIDKENKHSLKMHNPNGEYTLKTDSIEVCFGNNLNLYRCQKCGKVSQFNIDGHCSVIRCNGTLTNFIDNIEDYKNYYASLYKSAKISPLFIKEHTAQLSKNEALKYQQEFIKKEINALSSSTTFEMGVDVGDLETIFMRNIPPLPSNYAQRAGRAGRSIDAAAFVLTYAKLSSHDLNFFDNPEQMISGKIFPPMFKIQNEKIIKRHIYAVSFSLFFNEYPDQYNGNKADVFLNQGGCNLFVDWLTKKPERLRSLLKNSLVYSDIIINMSIEDFGWAKDLIGSEGLLTLVIKKYEEDVNNLKKQISIAASKEEHGLADKLQKVLRQYQNKELIDLLVRGNILPKYGFPIDSVELSQNLFSSKQKTVNLSRDLQIAISEYAPSSEVVADGDLYTSRYIKKPVVNHTQHETFELDFIAECPGCRNLNFSKNYVTKNDEPRPCIVCGEPIYPIHYNASIEPKDGFIAETEIKEVPLSSQERRYRTEAIYIGDESAVEIEKYDYTYGENHIILESSSNDSLVVKCTSDFYVCNNCGYTLAQDEIIAKNFENYTQNAFKIQNAIEHAGPIGKEKCKCKTLDRYSLHHKFNTDVAKLGFSIDTSNKETMLSVMFAILNSFTNVLSIEKRDVKACLTYKKIHGIMNHKIIIYDAVPGGAGHARRFSMDNGEVLHSIMKDALSMLKTCNCEPSCYKCLRNYDNQKIHEILDRKKAIIFLEELLYGTPSSK